ncbi:hypothetical protein AB0395_46740 [Streptosporangium sp. NPDC051023]|uniref:hypothetical protein n=1 Tax=Streptosporangium sp. NPDC051023 TaxID=3155410 RepID=UPI0034503397
MDAAQQAVLIQRELASTAPGSARPGLAGALIRLSATLSKGGAAHQALIAAREAVALYRALAAADPAAFRSELAASLNSLGNRLTALGRSARGPFGSGSELTVPSLRTPTLRSATVKVTIVNGPVLALLAAQKAISSRCLT